MNTNRIQRPPVPSGLSNPNQDSGWNRAQTGGAKNPWVRSGCHFDIATYNARTIGTDDRLVELEYELEKIRWDIVGISETRRRGEQCVKLNSGHVLFYKGDENNSIGGVGILINKRIAANLKTLKALSNRVIYITMIINKKTTLKYIQVYAPTSSHEDEEVETVYEDIAKALHENKTTHVIIGGDFNAKIGKNTDPTEICIGKFGIGTRNDRGTMLANFLEREKLYLMNTFFQKNEKRKWTWKSPNGDTKNEIDFIISKQKHIIQDVDVINQLNTGSDHRMIRCKVFIDVKLERARRMRRTTTKIGGEQLKDENENYKKQLSKNFSKNPGQPNESINEANKRITKTIKETAEQTIKPLRKSGDKLSNETKQMLERRRELIKKGKRDTIEFTETNKTVRKMAKQDILKYNTKQVQTLLEKNRGIKIYKRQNTQRKEIMKIRDETDKIIEDRTQILKVVESFYTDLYESKIPNETAKRENDDKTKRIVNINSEEMPDINVEELEKALNQMKNGKAAGEDDILPEMLKESDEKTKEELVKLFNLCLTHEQIPEGWENAMTVLIYKKGDPADLENYRPISLLSQLYKLFIRLITNRLDRKLELYQPKEQAGFRSNFSTTEHLHTVKQLVEKVTEYNIPIWMAFIDFRKAFDTIEIWAIIRSMRNARIDQRYINLIEYIYNTSTMSIKIHDSTNKINAKRGVRQGDVISPKLFTLVLEDIFKKLEWSNKGINIQGEYLNNLRFADDVVIFGKDEQELTKMMEELQEGAAKIGLFMNNTKTQFMTNTHEARGTISIHGQTINRVTSYIYLGQTITLGKQNQEIEVDRRIRLGWAAYGRLKYFLNMKIPMSLKTKIYNEYILPAVTYGSETWVLTKKTTNKLRVHQRAIERRLLGITLKDHKTNKWIREKTQVTDVIQRISSLKWKWAGHVARHKENWSGHITRWRPWGERRSTGRPQQRWYDELKKFAGLNWYQVAQNRDTWSKMREAYIQWIENG